MLLIRLITWHSCETVISGVEQSVLCVVIVIVVSTSHLVTWWMMGQLWVACLKVSWLSKHPGVLYVRLSVNTCMCQTLRHSASFLPLELQGFLGKGWLNLVSQTLLNSAHIHTLTPLPVNPLPQLPWPPPWQHIQCCHGNLCTLMAAPLTCDIMRGAVSWLVLEWPWWTRLLLNSRGRNGSVTV